VIVRDKDSKRAQGSPPSKKSTGISASSYWSERRV